MQKNREIVQRSESFPIGVLLALTGGFLDAYTYVSRGGVFANAQTGSINGTLAYTGDSERCSLRRRFCWLRGLSHPGN